MICKLLTVFLISGLFFYPGEKRLFAQPLAQGPLEATEEDFSTLMQEPGSSKKEEERAEPARNYLNMAVNYINRKRYEQARRYLELAQNSGDEGIYFEAEIWKLFLAGVEGKKGAGSNLQLLMGEDQAKGHYYLADGWQVHYENYPEKRDILELVIEYREKLVAQFPESQWAQRASLQLFPLFYQKKDYDKALFYLLNYFENRHLFEEQSSDKAWFYFGKILESASEYRDLHKALKAYLKVLENPDSQYYHQAQERILQIEKFYYITP